MKAVTNPDTKRTGYKRVMLKLGGEMFGGGKVGIVSLMRLFLSPFHLTHTCSLAHIPYSSKQFC